MTHTPLVTHMFQMALSFHWPYGDMYKCWSYSRLCWAVLCLCKWSHSFWYIFKLCLIFSRPRLKVVKFLLTKYMKIFVHILSSVHFCMVISTVACNTYILKLDCYYMCTFTPRRTIWGLETQQCKSKLYAQIYLHNLLLIPIGTGNSHHPRRRHQPGIVQCIRPQRSTLTEW